MAISTQQKANSGTEIGQLSRPGTPWNASGYMRLALEQRVADLLGADTGTFVSGGLAAIARETGAAWLQLELELEQQRGERLRNTYRDLERITAELLEQGAITNMFFMHKPPGLRVRFE